MAPPTSVRAAVSSPARSRGDKGGGKVVLEDLRRVALVRGGFEETPASSPEPQRPGDATSKGQVRVAHRTWTTAWAPEGFRQRAACRRTGSRRSRPQSGHSEAAARTACRRTTLKTMVCRSGQIRGDRAPPCAVLECSTTTSPGARSRDTMSQDVVSVARSASMSGSRGRDLLQELRAQLRV